MAGGRYLEWDYICGILQPHLSFLLYHFLPYSRTTPYDDVYKSSPLFMYDDNTVVLPTGSYMEGLSLPAILKKNSRGMIVRRIIQADADTMIVNMRKFVAEGEISNNDESIGYLLETEETHPGYARIRIIQPESTPKAWRSMVEGSGKVYFSGKKLIDMTLAYVNNLDPDESMERAGPAITIKVVQTDSSARMPQDGDCVHALCLPQWPTVAEEWTLRRRLWPSPDEIKEIVAKGCHVVAKEHPTSNNADIEWRLSFSIAESMLAKKLTKVQIQCYLLLKALHNAAFKEPKGIVSYHLKTVFFWTAEQIPQHLWTEDTIGQMLMILLDKLLHCLVRHNLPSYFIPANNLIDTIPVEIVNVIKQKVSRARIQPFKLLLGYNKYHKFILGPMLSDLDDVYNPVIKHGSNGLNACSQLDTCITKVFIPTATFLASTHLHDFVLTNKFSKPISLSQLDRPKAFDATVDIAADVCRLAGKCGYEDAPPATFIEAPIKRMTASNAIVKLCLFVLEKYPDAPNKEVFLQAIEEKASLF